MNATVSHAQTVLQHHPHPALLISELVELLRERCDRSLDVPKLRSMLEDHPDVFRVLDPWRGPWRSTAPGLADERRRRDAWVVTVADPGDRPQDMPAPLLRMRESVRWLGCVIDARSPIEVSRWYATVLSERAARQAMARRAA